MGTHPIFESDFDCLTERHLTGDQQLHFFLVGAGALIDSGSSKNFLLGKPVNNACLQGNPADHPAHCYFYWFTKTYTGAFAQMRTSASGVNIRYIESETDRLMYEYTLPPRNKQ